MSGPNESPSDKYDRTRCRVCGCNWEPFKDAQGRIFAGHPLGKTCSRYRPAPQALPETGGYVQVVHTNGEG